MSINAFVFEILTDQKYFYGPSWPFFTLNAPKRLYTALKFEIYQIFAQIAKIFRAQLEINWGLVRGYFMPWALVLKK